MPTAGWFCQLIHNLCFALSRIRCTRWVSATADALFLVLCGSCCRRWVGVNAAWFLRLCPDPIPRWELGACNSHTPHCCPPPWREIWVAGVKGAALFSDWVRSLTDQQPKVPRQTQMYLLCSPCEKTGLRNLNLRCRFLKVEVKDPRNRILQYAMCCSSLICTVTWMSLGVQCVPGSVTRLGGSFWWGSRAQSVPRGQLHHPPHPCLDLEARWVLREVWFWDVSSSARESREGLAWQLFSSIFPVFSSLIWFFFLISLVFNLRPFLIVVQKTNWSD